MGKNSRIEWTDHTWNPWVGCNKIAQGCKNCYMYRDQARRGIDPTNVRRTSDKTFNAPLAWKEPARVFVCSYSDFFHPAADGWRAEAWAIMKQCPHLTFLILTKRQEINDRFLWWSNVWFGVSASTQSDLDRLAPFLLTIPAMNHFVSLEPLVESIDVSPYLEEIDAGDEDHPEFRPPIDWVITGGESGPANKIRPAKPDWFRQIRDDCRASGIPYFHKQHGGDKKIGGVWGGRLLDGRTHDQLPERGTI